MFNGLFDSASATVISPKDFLLCVGVALVIGLFQTLCYLYKGRCSKGFAGTIAMLPAIVCVVIMLVNGNIGAGVAVAGAFSLVRFRSTPGTAKEIGAIFASMAVGLACGMGYPFFGLLFAIVFCAASLLYALIGFGGRRNAVMHRILRITVPEDLDYPTVFDDLLEKYTSEAKLTDVKTTNLGSLNRLTYELTLRKAGTEKDFIDELRCRNGNLEISMSIRPPESREIL